VSHAMPGRLSLRAQIALALAVTVLLGVALQTATTLPLLLATRADPTGAPTATLRAMLKLVVAYTVLDGFVLFFIGWFLMNRVVARPVDKLAEAAERIGRLELDSPFGEEPGLGHVGRAFERMAESLKAERHRVQTHIAELERVNRELAEARDSLVRSEKLATVGRLAAGVAHEIGNPLGAMLGYLELAKSRKPSPEVHDYLCRIDREIERIDRTVRELLDFSRPRSLEALGPVSLRGAVEAAIRLSSAQKRLKEVAFEVHIEPSLSVIADEHHLSQVLVNLLLNAGDAMKGAGHVFLRAAHAGGGRISLEVADDGPGILAADLQRVFDPFFTTKDPGEGTGLGLAICHRIMETFGGSICVKNGDLRGAVFTLTFRESAPRAPPSE